MRYSKMDVTHAVITCRSFIANRLPFHSTAICVPQITHSWVVVGMLECVTCANENRHLKHQEYLRNAQLKVSGQYVS